MGVVSKIGKNFQEKNWVGYLPTPYHNQSPQNQPFKPLPAHFHFPQPDHSTPQNHPHKNPHNH